MRGRVLALVAAGALVVAACGNSGGDTTTTTTGAETTTTVGGGTTTTGGEGGTRSTPGDGAALSGGGGDVGELVERFRQSRVRATYLFDEGDSAQELTLSQDPTANPPVSAVISEDDGFHVIFTGDDMTVCEADAQQCFTVPGQPGTDPTLFASAFLTPFLSSYLAFAATDAFGFDVDTEPITVAGRSGVCFTVSPEAFVGADFDEIRQCVDDEFGAVLLFEVKEPGGEFERVMELRDLREPLASDFEPPYELVEVPTG